MRSMRRLPIGSDHRPAAIAGEPATADLTTA
jgi:hypothetical protein